MDAGLLAWGRAVKRRSHARLPVLWLFTDAARLPDPLPAIRALPRGLCGVVFRHDNAADRAALGKRVAALCRVRGLPLVVAGDARLAARLGAGVHLRGGRWPGAVRRRKLLTASAHNIPQLKRGVREGAVILFLSPACATESHPMAKALGPCRWREMARRAGRKRVYCLGGVTGGNIKHFGRLAAGAGAITAFTSANQTPPPEATPARPQPAALFG